jgi:hypothetical protein
MECDFCSSPLVVRKFQCMDYDSNSGEAGVLYAKPKGLTDLRFHSLSFWAACGDCERLVEAGNIAGLIDHAIKALRKPGDSPSLEIGVRIHLRQTYELFFRNRIRVKEEHLDAGD